MSDVEDKKKYLAYLLKKEQWTSAEKQWMLTYLYGGDMQALREIAREQYHSDLLAEDVIDQQLSSSLLNKLHEHIHVPRVRKVPSFFKLAAAVAAIITLGTSIWFLQRREISLQEPTSCLQKVSTGYGERKELKLPDGTKVWLSPASRLEYPAAFSGGTRKVFLTGEAFFEVARDTSRPFLIRSGLIKTKVLGTAFNVKAYEKLDRMSVTVVHGKVAVYTREEEANGNIPEYLEVVSDQRAVFSKKEQEFSVEPDPSASLMLARRNGLLVYKGATLRSVIEDLSMQYGKDIVIRGNIVNCKYYGEFSMEDSLETGLRQIYLTLGATLTREGDVFVLSGDSC